MPIQPFTDLRTSKRHFLATLGLIVALVLATAGTITAAAPGVTVAVTGDIYTAEAKIVSDVILAHPALSAVLLAGDTCNASKTPIESYRELYRGTYDRFLAKIYPAPGNHDEHSTPPFSGYREFWGKAAHAPEMYYSFDLGGWHIVSLDSMTFLEGGAPAAAQLAWLKRDLAAKPKVPVLAYWHHPYFSNAKHNGQPKVKPFWDALFAHGPTLVFGGHNHVYERFAPMTSDGKKVPEAQGVRQFVVGPGGAKPVDKESDKAKGPPSEKFHGGTHHVGFITLHADGGFAFTIQSITGKGATEVVDKGAGNLLGGLIPAAN
jgi:3',5'-cyclic AMP phosphodiesterase CpdA